MPATLSAVCVAGEVTAREVGAALPVIEESARRLFHKTTWEQVRVGDTVLIPWEPLSEITEVEITKWVIRPGVDVEPLVRISFRFGYATYELSFDPNATAYVQSRL